MATQALPVFIQEIRSGSHDEFLEQIDLAVRYRKRAMFRPGSRVKVVNCSNPEIDGQVGTVVKVNVKRITVGFGEKNPWGFDKSYLMPVRMLETVT